MTMKPVFILIALSLSLSAFTQKLQETRRFDVPEELVIDGKMTVKLHRAKEVEVVIETENVDLKHVYTRYSDKELLIRVEPLDIEGGKVIIDAYLPAFSEVKLSRGAQTTISPKMLADNGVIKVSSGAEVKAGLKHSHVALKVTSGAFCELSGQLSFLKAKAHSGGIIRTDSLSLEHAKLIARTGGFIAANPRKKVTIRSTFGGEVKLLGDVDELTTHNLFGTIIME